MNNLKTKMSKINALLYKIKTSVNQNALHILYNSLILPYLTNCVEIWGNNYKSNIQPIFMLQKKAIRVFNYANYFTPTNPLFIKQNTLKFHDLVDLSTAVVMYKAHHLNFHTVSKNCSEDPVTSVKLKLGQI